MRRFSRSLQRLPSAALRLGILCLVLVGVFPERQPFRPVTVCEVLADPVAFDGRTVALLGVLQWGAEWFYMIENCGQSSEHEIAHVSQRGRINPSQFVLDRKSFEEKFAKIRMTTRLRVQKKKPRSSWSRVHEQWAIVFGRIESRNRQGSRYLDGSRAGISGPAILLNEDGSRK